MERKKILRVSAAAEMKNSISREIHTGGVSKVSPLPIIVPGYGGLHLQIGLFACLDLTGE